MVNFQASKCIIDYPIIHTLYSHFFFKVYLLQIVTTCNHN
uniref:Uncharacterized protein n=1 Tax=Anguilla anguilla TaxID=7936 RepID=A0A0E9SIU5_ANGAN